MLNNFTLFGIELHELLEIIVAIGTIYLVVNMIKAKAKVKVFEKISREDKLIMLETTKQLKEATVQTAACLGNATVETAKHLKETTIETAKILTNTSTKPYEMLKSIDNELEKANTKLDMLLSSLSMK